MKRLTLLLLLCWASLAQATSKVELFQQGLAAADAGDAQQLAQIQARLGDDFPLNGYLEYARLVAALPQVDPDQITAFRHQFSDTPLRSRIYPKALYAYAQAANWSAFLDLLVSPPNSTSYRCFYARALLETGEQGRGMKVVKQLIAAGDYLSSSCRAVFSWLAGQGLLDQGELLQLMRSAFHHRQHGWMTQLADHLPQGNEQRNWLLMLYQAPERLAEVPKHLPYRERIMLLAMRRLARLNEVAALAFWQQAPAGTFGSRAARKRMAIRIAWYSSIKKEQPNRQWLDAWLEQHAAIMPDTLQQRTRHAIKESDWKAVLHWIALLPADEQRSSHWEYWRGRAHAALKQPQKAAEAYQQAAKGRNFDAYMAARTLGLPYRLNAASPNHAQLHLSAEQRQILARVRLLLAAKQADDAQREWLYLLAHSSHQDEIALGRYAQVKHWYNFSIVTAIRADQWDRMEWRFPLAWEGYFKQAAKQLAPGNAYLMMAVSRRESSFFRFAESGAGARGLMQLMPATAEMMADELGIRLAEGSLFDAATNLKLGTSYLAGLLEQYQGNRVLALTAYNAGPARVKAWMRTTPQPVDIWVETIPFGETRRYVKAVLAYRVIFMLRAGYDSKDIDLLGKAAQQFAYSDRALDQIQQQPQLSARN